MDELPSTNFSPRVAMPSLQIGKLYTLRQAIAVHVSGSWCTVLFHCMSRLVRSLATIFLYLIHHSLSIKPWQPIRQRSSSSIARSFAPFGIIGITALSATVGSLAIFLFPYSGASCLSQTFPISNLDHTANLTISRKALSSGSYITTLSLSKLKITRNLSTRKQKENVRQGRGRDGFICFHSHIPETFHSKPTVATFPIRSLAKFLETLNLTKRDLLFLEFHY